MNAGNRKNTIFVYNNYCNYTNIGNTNKLSIKMLINKEKNTFSLMNLYSISLMLILADLLI